MPPRGLASWFALLGSTIAGCTFSAPDLEGRPCPCIDGYVCRDEVCVLASTDATIDVPRLDGGTLDAQREASTDDGGPDDATIEAATDSASEGDAGSPDAGPPDTGPLDAGPPDVPPTPRFCDTVSGAFVCLDFESELDPDWDIDDSGGMNVVQRDRSRAASGTHSLRIDTRGMGTNDSALIQITRVGSASSGTIWMRASLYVGRLDGERSSGMNYFSLSQETATNAKALALGFSGDRVLDYYLTQGATQLAGYRHTATRYPVDTWMCIEASLSIANPGTVQLYLNGDAIGSARQGNSSGTWSKVQVGTSFTHSDQPPATYWLDDVVWSRTRNPCP